MLFLNVSQPEIFYLLNLYYVPGVGKITAKKLMEECGSASAIFSEKKNNLLKIKGISNSLAEKLKKPVDIDIEKEIEILSKEKISFCSVVDSNYPKGLKQCPDAPLILFYKGILPDTNKRLISIVGTRSATNYGRENCEKFIEALRSYSVSIISGLAYGVDITAHKSAIKNNLHTAAVLGHGLKYIYPAQHKKVIPEILENGCMLTEYPFEIKPDKENFPERNRIISGLSEATIIIEASSKGGALITARISNGYHRDVFAFPGKNTDPFSKGCNMLIKNNEAALIESADDFIQMMGWNIEINKKNIQRVLFTELDEQEQKIYNVLEEKSEITIDEISLYSMLTASETSVKLFSLEMRGFIKALPGKKFRII